MNNKDMQVTECIREFKLRQQYPSMIKKPKNVRKVVVINTSSKPLISATAKLTSKTNIQVKNGFRKLRLKLPNGKDLGEFNVQILPDSSDTLKGKALTSFDDNKYKKVNKPLFSNEVSKNKTKRLVVVAPLQSINSNAQKKYSNEVSYNGNTNVDTKDNTVNYQSKIISLKSGIDNDQCHKEKKNTGIENMDIDINTIDSKSNENKDSRFSIIQNKEAQNNDNLESVRNTAFETSILENTKQSINTNSLEELSKYLSCSTVEKITNTKNFMIEVSNDSINASCISAETTEQNNSKFQNDNLLNAKKELYLLPNRKDKNVNLSLEQEYNTIDLKSDNYNLTQQIENTRCSQSTTENNKISQENVMVIVHNNETSLLNNDIIGTSVNNKNHNVHSDDVSFATATKDDNNNKSQTTFPHTFHQFNGKQYNMVPCVDNLSKENCTNETVLLQKKCSSCSILKEVMSTASIKNENLKVKALEALANCDIGIEQNISLDLPRDTKTTCDTKVQTDIHLLLEAEHFLNAKEDMSNVTKIMSKELHSANVPENLNTNSLNYLTFYENSIFSPFNQSQEPDTFLEKFISNDVIDDICNKHSVANKIKEVLSQPNVSHDKISDQLRRDFETVKKWDENGMLNIHKAVISNRIYDVQRHLMVLKACNVNVDSPTQSGMTSLELAIKYNASIEIIKLLLKAGANPVSFQPVHDSALILASKINHPLLPELIHHASLIKLLDYVDFTGFAALHYCAQYGNLEGVNSLINMGANVNLQESRSGRTALFLAIENNHPVIAQKLIKYGAQSDIPNFSGQTVMSLVDKINHFSLITLMHNNS